MSVESTICALKQSGNYRHIPMPEDMGRYVDLSSNDYLGIASRADLQNEFFERCGSRIPAMTSSASRLLAHNQDEYYALETTLSNLFGGRPALLFNSGYHANTGLLSALASEPGTLIVADRLVHASMIDGMVLSRKPFKRFAHNDIGQLKRIVEREYDGCERIIVAVESVYSMDGDSADIEALIELKRRYPKIWLYVDEAHAFGVCGPAGLGLSMGSSAAEEVDVIVGTFGKAAASMGAFAVTTPEIHEYAVNRSRSFIFSTALPPICCAWTRFVVERMTGMDAERRHLADLAAKLHGSLTELSPDATSKAPSHIIPYIVGDPKLAVEMSSRLLEAGFKVLPIRTPTVPPGTERLRISLSASLTMGDAERFGKAFNEVLCR